MPLEPYCSDVHDTTRSSTARSIIDSFYDTFDFEFIRRQCS